MTYASLEEAYGGVSGSNFLSIPSNSPPRTDRSLHPAQARAVDRRRKETLSIPDWRSCKEIQSNVWEYSSGKSFRK